LDEYRQEYEELNTLRDLENKISKLKDMMAWSQVKEAEDLLSSIGEEIKEKEKIISEFETTELTFEVKILFSKKRKKKKH